MKFMVVLYNNFSLFSCTMKIGLQLVYFPKIGGSPGGTPKGQQRTCPQGSLLGPRLSVLYTADVARIFPLCYADDTQLYFFCNPPQTVEVKRSCVLSAFQSGWRLDVSNPIRQNLSYYGVSPYSVAIYLTAVSQSLVVQESAHEAGIIIHSQFHSLLNI